MKNLPTNIGPFNTTYDYKKLIEIQGNQANTTVDKSKKTKDKVMQKKRYTKIIPNARRGV